MNQLQHEIFKFKGIVKDITPVELMNGVQPGPGMPPPNVWTHGQNVHFDNESTHRVGGYAGFADPLPAGAKPIFALNVLTPTQTYWIWVDGQAASAPLIYVTDGVNHFDISPPSSAELLTNGDFAGGATAWTDTSPVGQDNIQFLAGQCDFTFDGGDTGTRLDTGITQNIAGLIVGATYQITYEVMLHSQGAVYAKLGGTVGLKRTAPGIYTETIVAGNTGTLFEVSFAEEDTVLSIDNVTLIAGSTITGGQPGEWTGCVLNGVPVINNGVNPPMWWDGDTSNPMETLPDWPANQLCKVIRAYKYHLIALNLTRNSIQVPEQYAWSAGADPGTIPSEWTPLPSNDAGDNTLATGSGGILDGLALRDDFIIYKAHSTYIMSYIGGQFVFTIRKLFNTSGIQALNCVQELRGHHWVFTDDDMIKHDGNTFESIADKHVRNFILNGINPDTQLLAHVAANTPTDEIWFCFPTVDNTRLNVALLYSFTDGVWGTRNLPDVTYIASGIIPEDATDPTWDGSTFTWNTDPTYWNQASYSVTNDNLVMCSPDKSKLYNVDASEDNDGEPLTAFVERTDWALGGEANVWTNALIRSIYPTITGSPGDTITVQVAGTSIPGQAIPWSHPQSFTIGEHTLDSLKVDVLTHGRYLNIRFTSVGGSPWEIHRIGVEYIPKSKF